MKRYLLHTLIIVCSILFIRCVEQTPPTTNHISIAIDHSEVTTSVPSKEFFLSSIKKSNVFDGISLSLLHIGDTRYTSKQSFILKQGTTGWLSNEDERRKKRKHLFRQFSDSLDTHRNNTKSLDRSDIYRVVALELNRLAQQKGTRTLYLCSNLKENSSLISFYQRQHVQTLVQHPKVIQQLFEKQVPINNLSGVTLHIIYAPSKEAAVLFEHLVMLYKTLVESKGGVVVVGYHHTISI